MLITSSKTLIMLNKNQLVELYASFPSHNIVKTEGSKVIQINISELFKTNGETGGVPVILTQHQPFPIFPDYIDVDTEIIPHTEIKFRAKLDEVFIDYDDCDLTEFGIEGVSNKHWDAMNEIAKFEEEGKPYPVSELIKFGLKLDSDFSWYGCYVKEIKASDVIYIRQKTNSDYKN